MPAVRHCAYRGWDEFRSLLGRELYGDEQFRSGRFLFRGVCNADWELISSFDRLFPRIRDRTTRSSQLLEAFRQECEGDVPADILADEGKLMALGQHYGLPTRLLDWTMSPFLAAFFAFSDVLVHPERAGKLVAIWALDARLDVWSAESGVMIVTVPTVGNIRLRNQAGCFTQARTPKPTLEEYVESLGLEEPALTQFAMPAHDAERALAELEMMGITAARVFADLQGAATAATMRVRRDSQE